MASRIKYTSVDENTQSRLNAQLKNKSTLEGHSNMTTTGNEPQRRMVLGGLDNQILPKNALNRTLKPNLKEIKPKVDTHWKRNETMQPTVSLAGARKAAVVGSSQAPRVERAQVEARVASSTTTTTAQVVDAVRRATVKCGSSVAGSVRPLFRKASAEPISHSSRQLLTTQQHGDIDALDGNNPILMSEYVCDIYRYLQELETRYPIRTDFLDQHVEINPRMRSVLVDWINEVHFQFKLLPETYYMAIGLIDRYLQVERHVARKHLQLVGATALFVAAKYEELYPPVLADFVYITDNTYTEGQVIDMEKRILCALKFELCPPVAIQFLRRYSKAAQSEQQTHQLGKYLIELATMDYAMCHHSPSLKAAAALYLALIMLKTKTSLAESRFTDFWRKRSSGTSSPQSVQLWTANLAHYSNYKEAELRPIVQQLATLVLAAPKTKTCRAVFNKYSLDKFDKCARLPELSGSLIKTLAIDWSAAEDAVGGAAGAAAQ